MSNSIKLHKKNISKIESIVSITEELRKKCASDDRVEAIESQIISESEATIDGIRKKLVENILKNNEAHLKAFQKNSSDLKIKIPGSIMDKQRTNLLDKTFKVK